MKSMEEMLAASIMRQQIRPLSLDGNTLTYARDAQYRDDIVDTVRDGLAAATGTRWMLDEKPAGSDPNEPRSIAERDEDAKRFATDEAMAHPLVKATLSAFPDAELLPDNGGADETPPWRQNA